MYLLQILLQLSYILTHGRRLGGRGNTKVRTGDKLSNSHKTFCEHTPRLTPTELESATKLNRLLAVRQITNVLFLFFLLLQFLYLEVLKFFVQNKFLWKNLLNSCNRKMPYPQYSSRQFSKFHLPN